MAGPGHQGRLPHAGSASGQLIAVLSRRLAAAGMGVEVSRRRGTCELTILGAASGKSFVALDAGGRARWYYEPATGTGTKPAVLTSIITYLLGVPPGPVDPAPYRALPLKGQVGRSLQDQGLTVTLRISEDLDSFEATTDIDITSPALARHHPPLRGRRPRLALRLASCIPGEPGRLHRRDHPDPACTLTPPSSRRPSAVAGNICLVTRSRYWWMAH
jgi:hypothetical protein